MRQALSDITSYIRRDFYKFCILILLYAFFFILAGNIFLYAEDLMQNSQIYCKKNGYIYIKLVQNSFNSSVLDLWNIPMINDRMEITLKKIKDDSRFIFSSMSYGQDIGVFVNEIDRHFGNNPYDDYLGHSLYPGYYDEYPMYKPTVQTYLNEEKVINLAACKIDKESLEHYGLELSNGRTFNDNEYIFNLDKGTVSVLMGSEYQNYFKIGDTFRVATSMKIMEATIIGFLKPNTIIENDTTYENIIKKPTLLDYSIILPCFQKITGANSIEDRKFMSIEYISNLCGTLIFDEKTQTRDIKNSLKGINDYYLSEGIFTVIPLYSNNGFSYLQGEEKKLIDTLPVLIIFLIVYSSFVFHSSIIGFIEKQSPIFSIQLINGKKWTHLLISWFCIIAFVILVGLFLSFIYNRTWIFESVRFVFGIIFLALLLILINGYFLQKCIKNESISNMMWRY